MRIVLLHGAATTSRVWRHVVDVLRIDESTKDLEFVVPDRPQSGDLDTEVNVLMPFVENAFVVGVSGGATLGLELAARAATMRGAVLHEPAAGSLVPGLLEGVGAALEQDGVAGFGSALYGPAWTVGETDAARSTVEREFAMFGMFEPCSLLLGPERVLVTTGADSPARRRDVADALASRLGVRTALVPGVGHAAHLAAPAAFAAVIIGELRRSRERSRSLG